MKYFLLSFTVLFFFSEISCSDSKRIISLSPALTEIIFALGFGPNLVGVSEFSDYPPQAKKIKSVGAYTQPNIENIVALKPDLVFLPLEGPEDVKKRFDQLGLKYAIVSMRKLKEIGLAAEKVAEILGSAQVGINFKRKWDEDVVRAFRIRSKVSKIVFIEVQKEPLIAAGKDTFLDEIVTGCGASNIVNERNYPKISLEIPTVRKIDVVLLADHFDSPDELTSVKNWWRQRAHSPQKIEALDADITSRPGPRLIEGIKSICQILK